MDFTLISETYRIWGRQEAPTKLHQADFYRKKGIYLVTYGKTRVLNCRSNIGMVPVDWKTLLLLLYSRKLHAGNLMGLHFHTVILVYI